nr:zinc finger, CCHC-type [Tanacetum cinerariifolium]
SSSRLKISYKIVKIQVAQKKVKIAFENADLSSRVELIPSKIKYAIKIDSGATTHVCKDSCSFKTYEPVEDISVLYMGDDHFAPVYGKESVVLEFSSKKSILFNMLYVPKLRKNLISGPVLNKCGYRHVYEFDKYILSKSGVFIGSSYYNNGMFMLNLNKVPDDSGSVYMSSSTVVNSSSWYARLGHVNYKRMLEMSKDDLIPTIDKNPKKCTTCVIICLYVDDMLIFGTDQNQVDKTKKYLSSKFLMKDMEEADVILGYSPVSTPMDPVEKIKPNTGKPVDQLKYSRAIGCLMNTMMSTRPDIAFVVGTLSMFTSNPSRRHWHVITRVRLKDHLCEHEVLPLQEAWNWHPICSLMD